VNATEGLDNIEKLQQQLLNQMVDVDHQIRMLQEANYNNTATDSTVEYNTATDSNTTIILPYSHDPVTVDLCM
jgi:hypothetical protein